MNSRVFLFVALVSLLGFTTIVRGQCANCGNSAGVLGALLSRLGGLQNGNSQDQLLGELGSSCSDSKGCAVGNLLGGLFGGSSGLGGRRGGVASVGGFGKRRRKRQVVSTTLLQQSINRKTEVHRKPPMPGFLVGMPSQIQPNSDSSSTFITTISRNVIAPFAPNMTPGIVTDRDGHVFYNRI